MRIVTSRDLINEGMELLLFSFTDKEKHSHGIFVEKSVSMWTEGPEYIIDITRKDGNTTKFGAKKHVLMGVVPYSEKDGIKKFLVAIPVSSLDENDLFLLKLSNNADHIRAKTKKLINSYSIEHWVD